MARVQSEPFDPGAELAAFARGRENAGALASFTGLVRGEGVTALYLDHYPGFTEREIGKIEAEAKQRFDLIDTLVIHRFGTMRPGEPIVLAAVLARHRKAALQGIDFLMDYLKTDAPFWKREADAAGAHWIEPTAADRASRAAWERHVTTLSAGGRIDETLTFKPVRIAVLTVSDTRDEESDTSGRLLAERVQRDGHVLAARAQVKDDVAAIQARVRAWIADADIDAIITTGGTGLTGRDVTPEALRPLFDKEIDGFNTVWHLVSYQSVGLSTLQSRACAGLANGTFIFALPGSNGACKDGWDKVICKQLDSRHMPCNMVELMPRLNER
jgi:molybdenum cofactor biosynthesis protein B